MGFNSGFKGLSPLAGLMEQDMAHRKGFAYKE
jgi:hypothetical protein